MSDVEFAEAMAILELGTGKALGPRQVEVWFDCLKDLPIDVLRTAVKQYLIAGDDWPSIAKIRKLATDAQFGNLPGHGEAYGLVVSAVRAFGRMQLNKGREALGPMLWRVVKAMGGWNSFCDAEASDRSTIRAQFRMAYESIAALEQCQRLLPESLLKRIGEVGPDNGRTKSLPYVPYVPKGIE